MNEPQMLSVYEVAARLGLHPHTIKRIPVSDLPFYRVVRRGDRRYKTEDLEHYLNSRRANDDHTD